MASPLDQLKVSLSGTYTIERELGGGGMSRVYLAVETAFGRRVVVKLLEPELAAGVNIDRFKREIQLAAKLQHANIVPVIAAGESAGLPYYTMPFVDGESLRARIVRDGKLPIAETVAILRDVAKALAYAHERGIVHRDIKPENVLLAGDYATVADFGIAKALDASKTEEGSKLTVTGTSIGTLGYMSPEQAAGDPDVDHRTDIYSLGCLGYELLTGQAPFAGHAPQKLLAAHMTEAPRSIEEMRADAPPALVNLIMRALAKLPGARPQTSSEIVRELDSVASGASHRAESDPPVHESATLKRAVTLYAIAFVIVAVVARAAIGVIGLPDWVFPGALIVMALGLPVILYTAWSRGSWRRTVLGGAYAVGGFALVVAAFMALRALGMGPFASLLVAGEVGSEPLIVTEFRTVQADSTLGAVISQAVRTNLSQSTAFTLMSQDAMRFSLQRMQRPVDSKVDLMLAREMAARDGLKAIVDGEIAGIFGGFLVTVRLVSADSARELASFHAPAEGVKELIDVVDNLSRKLRGRIGESLRDVHASPALRQVTTASIDALRKYTDAWKAMGAQDAHKAIALAREALGIDSNFAGAWVVLATAMGNVRYPRPPIDSAHARAYELRNRLTNVERLGVTGAYFFGPGRDRAKSIDAFEAQWAMGWRTNTNSLGNQLVSRREYARADSFARQRLRVEPEFRITYGNLLLWQLFQGSVAAAESTYALGMGRFPGWGGTATKLASLRYARNDIDGAIAVLDSAQVQHVGAERADDLAMLARYTMLRGQLRRNEQLLREAAALRDTTREPSTISNAAEQVWAEAWFDRPSPTHVQRIDGLVATPAFTAAAPQYREYLELARTYAFLGRADRARDLLARYEMDVKDTAYKRSEQPRLHGVLGEIALAEQRPMDAVAKFRREDVAPDGPASSCLHCLPAALARAYDAAGNTDSTISAIEQYLAIPLGARDRLAGLSFGDHLYLAPFEKRLGELYDVKGNHAKAIDHYQKFVDLWKNADPELQPKVNAVRQRLSQLRASERK